MRKRIMFMLIYLVVMSFLLTACTPAASQTTAGTTTAGSTAAATGSSATTQETSAAEPLVVGFINYSDEIDATRIVHVGMEKVAKEKGVELLYTTAKSDAQQMISAADNFILQGIDVLVDFNFNEGGGAALKEKCATAGIPLISLDFNYGEGTYFVGVNNQKAGEFAGEGALAGIKEKFGGELDFLVMTVAASLGESINLRTRAVKDALRTGGIDLPDAKIIEMETGSGDMTQLAKQQATDFLTANPEAKKVLFISGNDQGGLGIMAAISSQNRNADCLLVTHGCEEPSRLALRDKDPIWYGSVDYQFEKYAVTVFDVIDRLMKGEEVDQESFVNLAFVTAANIQDFYPAK